GFLLHPERIQGKAALLEVFYGSGRVYLFGFRPQWRGQSHGTYKLIFNEIFDSPNSARPSAPLKPAEARPGDANPHTESSRPATSRVHADLSTIIRQNHTFFAAKGPQAIDERSKLFERVDEFEKERISDVQDAAGDLDPAARKKATEYLRQLRHIASEAKAHECDQSLTLETFI